MPIGIEAKRYENRTITKAIYATAWEPLLVVDVRSDGQIGLIRSVIGGRRATAAVSPEHIGGPKAR